MCPSARPLSFLAVAAHKSMSSLALQEPLTPKVFIAIEKLNINFGAKYFRRTLEETWKKPSAQA